MAFYPFFLIIDVLHFTVLKQKLSSEVHNIKEGQTGKHSRVRSVSCLAPRGFLLPVNRVSFQVWHPKGLTVGGTVASFKTALPLPHSRWHPLHMAASVQKSGLGANTSCFLLCLAVFLGKVSSYIFRVFKSMFCVFTGSKKTPSFCGTK